MSTFQFTFYFADNLNRNKKVIESLSMFVPNCTCLIQAMAFKILGSPRSEIRLVIGVSKKDKFESHAWACKDDKIVFGGYQSAKKFTKLIDF